MEHVHRFTCQFFNVMFETQLSVSVIVWPLPNMTNERILIRERVTVWQTMANETVLVDWTLFRSYICMQKWDLFWGNMKFMPREEYWNSVIDIIQINLIPLKVNINGAGFFLIDQNPVTQIFELYKQKIVVPSKLLNRLVQLL